eukprot:9084844-Ditylum_brightwellii.AAC.1
MHKPLAKKIACAKKEYDEARKEKCHGKSELCHKRHHSSGKYHAGKCKENIAINMVFATMTQSNATSIKLVESMFSQLTISWSSRGSSRSSSLRMPRGVPKNAALALKRSRISAHAMSNFEDLPISSSNKSVQNITSNTSVEGSDNKSHKMASKK